MTHVPRYKYLPGSWGNQSAIPHCVGTHSTSLSTLLFASPRFDMTRIKFSRKTSMNASFPPPLLSFICLCARDAAGRRRYGRPPLPSQTGVASGKHRLVNDLNVAGVCGWRRRQLPPGVGGVEESSPRACAECQVMRFIFFFFSCFVVLGASCLPVWV